jgi:hypothetical protein
VVNVDQRMQAAEQASRLLADPAFDACLSRIKDKLVARIEGVALTDFESEHELVRTLQVLKQIRQELVSTVNDGVMAKADLEHQNKLAQLQSKYLRRVA